MVSPGTYGRKTLNDNWVEDRHHSEEALSATGNISKKGARAYETDLAFIGDRYDVLSRLSRIPPRQTYATPDDGFNEKVTTNVSDFMHPRSHPMFASKKQSSPKLINEANAPVCPPEKRPLRGPDSGFGAGMDRHQKDHEGRFWSTTSSEFFGARTGSEPKKEPSVLQGAGVSSEHEENKGYGMSCGQLCGENHCASDNPAINTRTQRSWMPGTDPALTYIHHGGTKKTVPREDNHLSLPVGNGAMSKIRAELKNRNGRLCRTGTHITKGAHNKQGISIFQDD